MIAETAVPTLLEDWQTRRAQLQAEGHVTTDQAAALIKVLDYLIQRYEGTEAASQPARAAAPQATVLNTRAMVVHHHLWSGVVAGVKSPCEAQKRIAGVLHRMEESLHQTEAVADATPHDSDAGVGEVQGVKMRRNANRVALLRHCFTFRVSILWAIRRCLKASPYLPKYAVEYLADRASLASIYDDEVVALLARCASPRAYELTAQALATRIERVGKDEIVEGLAELLRNPTVQERFYPQSVEVSRFRVRERLASEDTKERIRTIRVLEWIGDLHDISLLADLATLCEREGAHPEEYAAFVVTLKAISRRPVE